MFKRCECGGCLATWTGNEGEDLNYRGLGVCTECGKYYQFKSRQAVFITKRQFDNIVNQKRREYFASRENNKKVV